MDRNRKNELLEKKLQLKEEVRKKELKKRIKYHIDFLESNGFTYKINYNHEYLDWMQTAFPMRKKDGYFGLHDYQIDVNDIADNCKTIHFKEETELKSILEKELLKYYSINDEIVICVNGGDPELIISIETFLTDQLQFLNNPEVWLILRDKSMVIEYIFDRKSICFIRNVT